MESFNFENNQELTIEEKISKLKENTKEIYSPDFLTMGHGTSEKCAKNILENGLEARSGNLDETAVSLFDQSLSYEEQPKGCFEKILDWEHRGYKYIVTIMIPLPKKDERGGRHYFNSVFEELPEEKKVSVGVQGVDKEYVIPSHFIKGYIDADKLEFIKNEKYNPSIKVELKKIEDFHYHQENGSVDIPTIPEDGSKEDVW